MLYINSFCSMYSVCICSWWWDVHTCIYFVSSVVFVDFLIKSSSQKKNSIDFIIDKSIVSDKTKIANGFNDYFVNVGSSLSSNIHCNANLLSYVEANPNSIVTPSLTVGDIINVISSLNNSSAGYE